LAANRTPKVIALAANEANSINTKKGAKIIGAPAGINIAKKFNLKFCKLKIIHENHILKLNPNVTTICAVGVNVYGTIPTKFNTKINKNNVNKNGKYLNPALPILSLTTLTIFSYKISITDCHRPGINKPFSILETCKK